MAISGRRESLRTRSQVDKTHLAISPVEQICPWSFISGVTSVHGLIANQPSEGLNDVAD